MILGEATREKITANDFVKYMTLPDGRHIVGFCDGNGEHLCSIPVQSMKEGLETADKFQNILAEAIAKHQQDTDTEQRVIDDFHKLFYSKGAILQRTDGQLELAHHTQATYMGVVVTQKNPLDLWIYQEILFDTEPDFILECGTSFGGSTLYLAHLLDQLNHGRILSVDISKKASPRHPRITYLTGDTLDEEIANKIFKTVGADQTMVILDDDHSCDHVLKELELYSPYVDKGQYLIVEDTNVNGHPVMNGYGPGPAEAVEKFLVNNTDFEVDRSREKFVFSSNPGGYLRRK